MRQILLVAAAAILIAGCGTDVRKTHPVTGTLTIDGAPADAGIVIWLHPQFTESDKYPIHPRGETSTAGEFKITTYKTDDGAPEGEYVATVEWPQRVGQSSQFSGDLLGGAFSKPDLNKAKPEFKVNVTPQGATLTLNLTLTPQQKTALAAAKKKAAASGSPGFNLTGE